jgi:hypothetical protein
MKRIILVGLVLTIVIFLPRLFGHQPWDAARRLWARVTEPAAAASATPAPPPGPSVADRLGSLETLTGRQQRALDEERALREGAIEALSRRVRRLAGLVATDRLRRRVDEGLFKVPAWQAPLAAKLAVGDLPRYLKVGVGLVEATGEDVPAELGPLLAEVALHLLTESRMKSVRLYRESPDAPSPNLNLSFRLRHTLTATGGLELRAVLSEAGNEAALWEGTATGDEYVGVVRDVVTAVVGSGLGGRVGGGGE